MKLFGQLSGSLAVAALVAALGMSAPAIAADKILTVAQPGETGLDNLDPRIKISTAHQFVQIGLFDPLVRSVGPDIEPGAAESWEISNDGRVYTFHLRDANWSDGKPVTAGDFVHAFQRMFVTSGASSIYDDVLNSAELREGKVKPEDLGVKALDDKTVEITLKNPTPYFMGLISSTFAAPGRADLVEEYGDAYGATADTIETNGPFLLKSWEHENEIVMVKNPAYWNADAIKLDEVDILVLPDTNTQRNLFDNGGLDLYGLAVALTDEEVKTYGAEGKLLRYKRGGYRGLTFNNFGQGDPAKAAILSDPNFRKAISWALDRQAYVDNVLGGNGAPATIQTPSGHAIYPGKTWGEVTPNIGKYHPFSADMTIANEYMAKVLDAHGYASVDQLPTFDLLTSQDPTNPKLFTPYALSVLTQKLGLKINLKHVTGAEYWNEFKAPALAYDLSVTGWGPDYDDPFTYMGYWVTSSDDMGVTFNNAEFDALLAKANAETDLVKRADILVEAEALFSDIGPSVPFIHFGGVVAIQPWVKNIKTSIFGVNINYVYADIEK